VVVRVDVHDHLVLPIEPLMAKKTAWEEIPRLHEAFRPVIERIKHLTSHGLSAMMVLYDFPSRHIAPLQDRTHPAWMYTEAGDATWLECGCDSGLDPNVLGTLLVRLSPDLSSVNFVSPRADCTPVCSNQAA
jgi:hypothetical protein